MPTPISSPTPRSDKAAVAASLTPADHSAVIRHLRDAPVRQRAVIEPGNLDNDDQTNWARKGEARRDRRADRAVPTAEAELDEEAGNILCITGQSPTGRKFRIRFVPNDKASAPIARRA